MKDHLPVLVSNIRLLWECIEYLGGRIKIA